MAAPRTRLVSHRSALGHWEILLREPHPSLRAHVRGRYEGFFESEASFARRLEVPFPGVVLIVNFGAAWGMVDRDHPTRPPEKRDSFVAGLHDGYSLVESTGVSCCVQVNLTPLGARRLFGLPMHELANRTVALEDALGPAARPLAERLGELRRRARSAWPAESSRRARSAWPAESSRRARSAWPAESSVWESRFALLDSFLAARLARGLEPSSAVAFAWERLAEKAGLVEIGALAAELGWSRKRLIAEFRDDIGLPPKTLARIFRFHRAVERLAGAEGARFAELAHECGYYDQAHFNRDFREFAGSTPGEFLRRRLPDGGGVVGD